MAEKEEIQRLTGLFKGWIIDKTDLLVQMPEYPIRVFINGYREPVSGKITWTATIATGQVLAKDKQANSGKLQGMVKERFREQIGTWEAY